MMLLLGRMLRIQPAVASRRTVATLTTQGIRQRFAEYFMKHGHILRPSANIVPTNDSTLLFTNAGMVPFKQQFVQPQTAPHAMVASIQKCVRAGGKHNDLDQVGYTPRHHTFFEMLGSFSFGAYGKQQAIQLAWGFVRDELQLPVNRLRVTVLRGDDEAYSAWRDDIRLDTGQIVQLGEEDNFWSMGHGEGPCGPCSELFWDTGKGPANHEDRWLEFWNLVFMQHYRTSDGRLEPLAQPCIDTGMGLERIASIVQGVDSNYETKELHALVAAVGGSDNQALRRIVADHLRASAFLIAEGVHPASTGRGYVLRRIIRRAVRAGRQLGIVGPVLAPLYPHLVATMGAAYPELAERRAAVEAVLVAEEDAFRSTLDKGLALLESRIIADQRTGSKVVGAQDVFTLYDTHGFPADLTQAIARDHGWTADIEGFETLLQRSRERTRERSRTGSGSDAMADEIAAVCADWQRDASPRGARFCGYDIDPEARDARVDSRVLAFRELSTGDALVAIDPSPFYAAGGGQEADTGTLIVDGTSLAVTRVVPQAVCGLHGVLVVRRDPSIDALRTSGTHIVAAIAMPRRRGCAVHHTATHLLHNALRSVLGPGVAQAGSLVRSTGLRFDFTAHALTADQLDRVAAHVNAAAQADASVKVSYMSLMQAQDELGALSVRAERHDASRVRVVQMGASSELCGGTHLRSTRAVYPFVIVAEASVGAGTRRIDAVAGDAASEWLQKQLAHARAAAAAVGAPSVAALEQRVCVLESSAREARAETAMWLTVAASGIRDASTLDTMLGNPRVPTRIHILPLAASEDAASDARLATERANHLRSIEPMFAHLVIRGRAVSLAVDPVVITDAHAGRLLRVLLDVVPGKGGGQQALAKGRLESTVSDPDALLPVLMPPTSC
ncbi:hypothetical protein EV175_001027 [Coemansia sp. RSA 1933]|nr:hypothetical protein EV175_001027 [Coemansia sp. RSA 1933]